MAAGLSAGSAMVSAERESLYSAGSLTTLTSAGAGAAFLAGAAFFVAGCFTALDVIGRGAKGGCCASPSHGQSARVSSRISEENLARGAGSPHILGCGAMQTRAPVLTTPANSATGPRVAKSGRSAGLGDSG